VRPALVAHRAGNSLGGLRAAEAAGIRTVEADVQLLGRRAVLRHPACVRGRELGWEPWARAAAFRRLTLDELLAAAAGETELMLDLKGDDMRLAETVRASLEPWLGRRRLALCGRFWPLLEPFEDVAGVRVVRSAGSAEELLRLVGRRDPLDGVCVRERLLNERLVALLGERAVSVLAWTVNSPARAHELAAWGVDGIVSDDLGLLERAVAAPLAA
jgi:glycerophosphoryl diester phosphodiesterase